MRSAGYKFYGFAFLDRNVVFLDGLTRKGDYWLLLFYRELMDRGSFLCWQTIHTSFSGIPDILLIDIRLYGLERVVNACYRCCSELMVRDPIRVDDRFIRQTLDPHLIVRFV